MCHHKLETLTAMPTAITQPNPSVGESYLLEACLRVRGHGLNLTQLSTLLHIAAFGPQTMTTIGSFLRLTTAALTLTADSLETSLLITREPEPDPADRRTWHLTLTDKGRETLSNITGALTNVITRGTSTKA